MLSTSSCYLLENNHWSKSCIQLLCYYFSLGNFICPLIIDKKKVENKSNVHEYSILHF